MCLCADVCVRARAWELLRLRVASAGWKQKRTVKQPASRCRRCLSARPPRPAVNASSCPAGATPIVRSVKRQEEKGEGNKGRGPNSHSVTSVAQSVDTPAHTEKKRQANKLKPAFFRLSFVSRQIDRLEFPLSAGDTPEMNAPWYCTPKVFNFTLRYNPATPASLPKALQSDQHDTPQRLSDFAKLACGSVKYGLLEFRLLVPC